MEPIILRTYGGTWKFEIKVYSIGNFRFPVPMNPRTLGYFGLGLITVGILLKICPLLKAIPFVGKYVLAPYGIMRFLTKKKFDGKLPILWLKGYLDYVMLPEHLSRFQPIPALQQKGHFTNVAFRRVGRVAAYEL